MYILLGWFKALLCETMAIVYTSDMRQMNTEHRLSDPYLTSDVRITRKRSSSQFTFPTTIPYITLGANLGLCDAIPDLWYDLNFAAIHVHFPRGHINTVILYYCGFCTGYIGMT